MLDTLAYVHAHGDEKVAGLVLVDNSVGEEPAAAAVARRRASRPQPAACDRDAAASCAACSARRRARRYLDRLTEATLRTPEPASRRCSPIPVPRSYWRDAVYSTDKPVLYVVRPGLAAEQAANLARNRPGTRDRGVPLTPATRCSSMTRRGSTRCWQASSGAGRLAVSGRARRSGCRCSSSRWPRWDTKSALTRYFAVAKWSEYGYWVISIVMVGFALSGVVLALFRDAFARHGEPLLAALPALLVADRGDRLPLHHHQSVQPAAIAEPGDLGSRSSGTSPATTPCLLPFFFLAGLFVSLSFVLNADRIGRVYGFDLTGAGAGAALVLAAMFVVHAVLPGAGCCWCRWPPAPASCAGRWRWCAAWRRSLALLGGRGAAAARQPGAVQRFQGDLCAAAHAGCADRWPSAARRAASTRCWTISPSASTPTSPTTPACWACRAAAHLRPVPRRQPHRRAAEARARSMSAMPRAALDALPYQLIPHAERAAGRRLRRIPHRRGSGARAQRRSTRWSPSRCCRARCSDGLGPSPPWRPTAACSLSGEGPVAAARSAAATTSSICRPISWMRRRPMRRRFTVEAIADYLRALAPGGIVSIPVSIRDFPVYALRMLATARAALLARRHQRSGAHIVVSTAPPGASRILLSDTPWERRPHRRGAAVLRRALVRRVVVSRHRSRPPRAPASTTTCRRSLSPPARSPPAARTIPSPTRPRAVLAGTTDRHRATAFNLAPITLDRPFFYAVLRLDQIGTLLQRLEILPQAEIGALVNLAVLAQAVVIAVPGAAGAARCAGPVARRRRRLLRPIAVFPGAWASASCSSRSS